MWVQPLGWEDHNEFQYSCLENLMGKRSWKATSPQDHKELDELDTTEVT